MIRRMFWALLLLTILYGASMQIQMNSYVPPSPLGLGVSAGCPDSGQPAIVKLELSRDPVCFSGLIAPVSDGSSQAEMGRKINLQIATENTYLDLGFIALYWATFVAFAAIYAARSGHNTTRALCLAIAVVITAVALYDYREDLHLFRSFSAVAQNRLDFTPPGSASMVKWSLFGIASSLLGFLPLTDEGVAKRSLGTLLVISGIAIAWGTLRSSNPSLGMGGLAMSLALALVIYWPRPKQHGT